MIFYWHSYYPNIDELNQVVEHFSGKIEVEEIEIHKSASPHYKVYLITGDTDAYKTNLAEFVSIYFKPFLFLCLKNRNEKEKEKIFQLSKGELVNAIENSPIEYFVYFAVTVIKK